jgi:CRISPR-associated protein Csx17
METVSPATTLLPGLRPVPVAGYLAALGVLSVLGEQLDPHCRGGWRQGCFFLQSRLGPDEVVEFFVHRFCPTPLASPWNGASGFYGQAREAAIGALAGSEQPRFAAYRATLGAIEAVLEGLALRQKPRSPAEKWALLKALELGLPPLGRRWLDAVVDLQGETPLYRPLLFTGGNDAKLDLARQSMAALKFLFLAPRSRPEKAARLLRSLLFDESLGERASPQSQGAFFPVTVEALNGSSAGEGVQRSNPWSQILSLEGVVALRGWPCSRLAIAAGGASLAMGEARRDDEWLPCWSRPLSMDELREALDGGGPDIEGHWRYASVRRNGKAHFVVPVSFRPASRAAFWGASLGWLTGSGRLSEGFLEALTRHQEGGCRAALGEALEELGRLRLHASTFPSLEPEWHAAASDGSHEFALASALTGLGAGVGVGRALWLRPQMGDFAGEDLCAMMVRLAHRRVWDAGRVSKRRIRSGGRRFNGPFWSCRSAGAADIGAFLRADVSDARTERLVHALCLLRGAVPADPAPGRAVLPYPFRLLKLCFDQGGGDRRPAPLEVLGLLGEGRLEEALACGWRFLSLRHGGLISPPSCAALDRSGCRRLAAALLLPISAELYAELLDSVSRRLRAPR